jgi:plastocyanin
VNLLPVALAMVLVGLAVSLIGCGGGGTDSTSSGSSSGAKAAAPSQSAEAVTISEYEYAPASIAVPVGAVVKITNTDSTAHTLTSKESGVFESGPIEPGKTGQIKLEKPGTFAYYCAFHPFMKGTITVE